MSSTRSRRCRVPLRLVLAALVLFSATASAATSPPEPPTCHDRYDRAVAELRFGRVRASLATLDALVRACRDDALLAKTNFLRAEVLLLDGDWDAADAAARAARDWTADWTANPAATSAPSSRRPPLPAHRARALAAADRVLASSASTRRAHARASSHLAAGRHEAAFWTATSAIDTSPRAAHLYVLRARASVELDLYARARLDVAAALRLDPAGADAADAFLALADGLRRCVRTRRALRAAVGVARDCLRVDPEANACRARLRADLALVRLADAADVAESRREWRDAATTLLAFRDADVEEIFRLETDAGLCRVESRAARAIARVGVGVGVMREADAATAAAAEAAIRACAAALPGLEAAATENAAVDGGNAAVALARAWVDRGWARLLRGMVDAADADAAAAGRALDDANPGRSGEREEDETDDDDDDDDEEGTDDDENDEGKETLSPSSSSSSSSAALHASSPFASASDSDPANPSAAARRAIRELRRAIASAREASAPKDLYELLGVSRADAEAEDWRARLKRAYRRLALLYHPDKNPADPEVAAAKFLEISEAYRVLSDDARRREYDATGRAGDADGNADGTPARPRGRDRGDAHRPPGSPEEWSFKFDKRDVGADGVARGRWRHRDTGEETEGERDVSPPERKNPCRRKHACVAGRGGVPTPGALRGHARAIATRVTDANSARNVAAARVVVNHLALQTLDVRFTHAHARGTSPGSKTTRPRGVRHERSGEGERADSGIRDPMRAVVRARIVALVRAVHAALAVGERAGPARATLDPGVAADVAEAAAAARGDFERLVAAFTSRGYSGGWSGGRDGADLREMTAAAKSIAGAAAEELRRRGALGAHVAAAAGVVGDDGNDPAVVSAAAVAAAEELCDAPGVLYRVLRVPTPEEVRAADAPAGEDDATSSSDRWTYAAWGGGPPGNARGDGAPGYVVRPGDVLTYEVKWYPVQTVDPDDPVAGVDPRDEDEFSEEEPEETSSGGGGFFPREGAAAADSDPPALVALDVETEDGVRLSATRATDQHGLLAHPSADLRGAMRTRGVAGWLTRRVPFPREMHGRTLTSWMAGCEHDAPARVRASLRNIRVIGEDGEEAYVALGSTGRPRVVSDEDDE